MLKKTNTTAILILFLTLTMVLFNQNNTSFASTSDPSRLNIYTGPTSVLADNNTYNCIFVQLQDSTGRPARAIENTTISLSSSLTNIGTVNPLITILTGTTYASANFNTTFSPGTTTISATATGYATVQATVTTVGPFPSVIATYGFPSTLPADGNTYPAIMLQLQDSSGNPARAPQGGIQVTLSCSDTSVGTVPSTATITEGQTYTITNFTTTTKAQTEGTAEFTTITAVSQGYTSSQLTITTTPVATNPTQLEIFVGPTKIPADQSSYTQIAVQLQNATGFVAVNQTDIMVTLTSNDQTVCTIDSITIPQMQPYVLATLNTTYKAGSATLTAIATDLLWDYQSISTFGFIPSKLGVYCVPVNLPSDNKTYQAIRVQLQDAQGRPAKDPQTDVSINLFSSQPIIGVVSSTLTIPFGKTQATGNLTVTNAPGTTAITAQASGYTTGLNSITTTLIDYSPLQITLTANPNSITNAYTTLITAYITADGAPVNGATPSFASNNGGSFGTIVEKGNGYYNVSFTAPSFSTITNCTITASGSKTGYLNAQGTIQITVSPSSAPTATSTPIPTTTTTPTPTPNATPTPTPTQTPALTTATLIFKITDEQGNPLNDTLVTSIVQPAGTQTLLQISNATGYVSFQNTPTGSYTFKIIKQGYPETNETLDYSGQPLTLSIPLTANTESNPNSNTLIVIGAVIIIAVALAAVVIVLLVKRRKTPNIRNLQELRKQMNNNKKF
jgi:hypothetical protein